MVFGAFDLHMAAHFGLGAEAVIGLDGEGNAEGDFDVVPAEEAVHLGGIFTPGAGLDHQVGGLGAIFLVFLGLAVNGGVAAAAGVAEEVFDEEGLLLAGLLVTGGEGMPPPVVAAVALTAVELARIACDFVFVEHGYFSFWVADLDVL